MIQILIVDDEKIERNGIKFLLKQLHMEAEIITRCRDIFNGFAMPMQETASKNDENKNKAVCQKDDFANKHFIGKPEIMEVSMNTDDTEKEGMVCGGNISVMLERM